MKNIDRYKADCTTAFANAVFQSYDKAKKAGQQLSLNFPAQRGE